MPVASRFILPSSHSQSYSDDTIHVQETLFEKLLHTMAASLILVGAAAFMATGGSAAAVRCIELGWAFADDIKE
jgi:hypothetical protein